MGEQISRPKALALRPSRLSASTKAVDEDNTVKKNS
jgi:hypothetical protein